MTHPVDFRVLRPPGATPAPQRQETRIPPGAGFGAALARAQQAQTVAFSAHASDRLARRGIRLNDSDRERIAGAVRSAEEKGGRTSLVLLDDVALIVNVPSRTVVTAMGAGTDSERVFTNIDSAVIA